MSGILKNSKHELFAQCVAKGMSDLAAYKKVFKCSERAALSNAYMLRSEAMEKNGVNKRIVELLSRTATSTTLTIQERREIAAEIARNAEVEPNVRLTATVVEAKHAGEFLDRQDLTSNGEALPTVMPTITLNVPKHFIQRRGQKG